MAYTELRKLYYKNEKQYKQTYLQRFTDENTILLDFFVGGKQAFIYQCPEVYNTMFSILKLDKEISELCNELPGKALEQYSRKCLIDEIVLTNNIEGVSAVNLLPFLPVKIFGVSMMRSYWTK